MSVYQVDPDSLVFRARTAIDHITRLALILPFSQVRAVFMTTSVGELTATTDPQKYYQIQGVPSPVSRQEIEAAWENIFVIGEEPNTREISPPLSQSRKEYYLDLAMLEMNKAITPYDKVGAFLSVFKLMRAEVYRDSGLGSIQTRHFQLRESMTRLLIQSSACALATTNTAIVEHGFGRLVNDMYRHNAVRPVLDGKVRLKNEQYTKEAFFKLSPDSYDDWTTDKNVIVPQRMRLGAVLKTLNPAALPALFQIDNRHLTRCDAYPRRPPLWYVLNDYLAKANQATWDRRFFIDAILRHGFADLKYDDPISVRFYRDTITPLMPGMDDVVFARKWKIVEKAAWRDYRRLKQTVSAHYGSAFNRFVNPTKGELVNGLKRDITAVFDAPFKDVEPKVNEMLLNRIIPGLGARYANISLSTSVLGLADVERSELFNAAVIDCSIKKESRPNMLDSLSDIITV